MNELFFRRLLKRCPTLKELLSQVSLGEISKGVVGALIELMEE